jgi:hypothetical protein
MSEDDPFRPPTDAEIAAAEERLQFQFPADYKDFLKSGADISDAGLEAAVILPGAGHLDIFDMAAEAWDDAEVPRDLVPIVEDNGDYFCLTRDGGVVYWSHNGKTDEEWPTFTAWFDQVVIEEGDYEEEDEEDDLDGDFDDDDDEDED